MKQKKSRYYEEDSASYQSSQGSKGLFDYAKIAAFGAIFIFGLVVGIIFTSGNTVNATNMESSIALDQKAPDAVLCQEFGASAMVTDMRVFVTLRPFNVFVTQPTMTPGCVVRHHNAGVLEKKGIVDSQTVDKCTRRMNTLGYTDSPDGKPQVSCVYKNDSAANLFLTKEEAASLGSHSDIY